MAPRSRAKKDEQDIQLLTALRFIEVAQHETGVPYQTHCRLAGNQVVAFDGVLAAGHPLEIEAHGAPNTKKLIAALSKVRGGFTLTMLDSHQLAIAGGAYRALVPCLPPVEIGDTYADAALYKIGPEFIEAGEKASLFVTDAAQTVLGSSLITQGWSLIGTNGVALIEAAHPYNTPAGLMIPHTFIAAARKCNLAPVAFGFSEASFTLHFDNGAWLRTQLYQDALPKLDAVLSAMDQRTVTDIPSNLAQAVDAVLPFTDDGKTMYLENNKVTSHETSAIGAQYDCDGLPSRIVVNGKFLKQMLPQFSTIDLYTHADKIVFYGKGVRGLLMKYGRK